MAESTLSLTYTALERSIGRLLGLNRDSSEWAANEVEDVADVIAEGFRRFLRPPPLPREMIVHRWSFLRCPAEIVLWADTSGTNSGAPVYTALAGTSVVTAAAATFHPSMVGADLDYTVSEGSFTITAYTSPTVVTVSGDASGENGTAFTMTADGNYRLSDDFDGVVGVFTLQDEDSYVEIRPGAEHRIRVARQSYGGTGTPTMLAVRALASDQETPQRWELMAYPISASDKTADYVYEIRPDSLTSTKAYHLGGMSYSEAVLECCLWAAEDTLEDKTGIHAERAQLALVSAVMRDRQAAAPMLLGRNTIPGVVAGRHVTNVYLDGVQIMGD